MHCIFVVAVTVVKLYLAKVFANYKKMTKYFLARCYVCLAFCILHIKYFNSSMFSHCLHSSLFFFCLPHWTLEQKLNICNSKTRKPSFSIYILRHSKQKTYDNKYEKSNH